MLAYWLNQGKSSFHHDKRLYLTSIFDKVIKFSFAVNQQDFFVLFFEKY